MEGSNSRIILRLKFEVVFLSPTLSHCFRGIFLHLSSWIVGYRNERKAKKLCSICANYACRFRTLSCVSHPVISKRCLRSSSNWNGRLKMSENNCTLVVLIVTLGFRIFTPFPAPSRRIGLLWSLYFLQTYLVVANYGKVIRKPLPR